MSPAPSTGGLAGDTALVLGFGVTGAAVAAALLQRGVAVLAVDDAPGPAARQRAEALGLDLVEAPDDHRLGALTSAATSVIPSPGVPDHHPVFVLARERGVPVLSELDLAANWDQRPCVAITGTDGKTTVTTLVVAMLRASGVKAVDAGNTETPLVAAIADPAIEVFVVEASSFRLAPVDRFRPAVGTWLNFAPDHQDAHADLAAYEAAKARIWRNHAGDDLAVANAEDPVVMRHAPSRGRVETFGLDRGDWRRRGDELVTPSGEVLVAVEELFRALPHDLTNTLAAAASALGAGATLAGAGRAAIAFRGLAHRVAFVDEAAGVRWFDDSKATAPHATLAAVAGFSSVVLIAGGRNKGLDLGRLADAAPRVHAVVAIGEAAPEVVAAFEGRRPVHTADSMSAAVDLAGSLARPGDVVLLSPGCASFDAYGSYAERGDDFAHNVHRYLERP